MTDIWCVEEQNNNYICFVDTLCNFVLVLLICFLSTKLVQNYITQFVVNGLVALLINNEFLLTIKSQGVPVSVLVIFQYFGIGKSFSEIP